MDSTSPRLVPNPIRIRRVVGKSGETVHPMVWCRRDADSRGASDCLQCRAFAGLSYDSQGGAQEVNVFCEVEPPAATPDDQPTLPSVARRVPIAQLVDRDLICVRPDVSVRRALSIMLTNQLECLPVVDELGVPVGIFTEARALALCNEALDRAERDRNQLIDRELGPSAPPPPLVVAALISIADAITKMRRGAVDHMLVVCRDGRLIGVLGTRDLLAWLCPVE